MQNAHRRLGRLEYLRSSEKTRTQIFLHVDHYVGDGDQAHLLSLFGGDAEVGAIRAANGSHLSDLPTNRPCANFPLPNRNTVSSTTYRRLTWPSRQRTNLPRGGPS